MPKASKYTDSQVVEFMKCLIKEIDEDLYKSYFVYDRDSLEAQDPAPLFRIFMEHFEK